MAPPLRVLTATLGLAGALLGSAPLALAAPRGAATLVRIELDAAVPLVDARPELRLDGRVLGRARVVGGDVLELAVPSLPAASIPRVEAWLGGRRLDGPGVARRPARQALPIRPATPVGTPVAVDPGARGPYATTRARYRLPALPIAGLAAPVEVVGEVTLPTGAPGARPLVLILHGRHGACFRGTDVTGGWPCRRGYAPIASETGYHAIADLLASQGSIVVSIAANGINGQDDVLADGGASARAALVAHHLEQWTRWATSGGAPFANLVGAVDTTRTILIGHSRGGEGVARLATLGPDGAAWRIRGLLLIAPTDFAFQPALGVATAVLLPTCDGDVSDLQGQLFVDTGRDAVPGDAALRSSVLVVGGSHNAFNTEWMPATATAPAFDDSACIDEPERISARTQRAVGATYAAALVHAALDGDLDAASLLDGSPVHAPSAGPAVVRSAALGGARSTVIRAGRTTPRATAGLTARPCATAARRSTPCLAASSPHFLQIENGGPLSQPGIALRWSRAGGSTTLPIAATPLPPGTTHVDLRAIVGPASPAVRVRASLLDATGAAHPLAPPAAASRQPGPGEGWTSWAQTLRYALPALPAGTTVTGLRLQPTSGRGALIVLDASLRGPGLPAIAPIELPRVDVGALSVREGGPALRTLRLPLTVTGTATPGAKVRVFVTAPSGRQTARTVALTPGASRIVVPVPVRGNSRYDLASPGPVVAIFPVAGARTGHSATTIDMREDDPRPRVLVTPRRISVREGELVRIRVRLTRRVTSAGFEIVAVPLPAGRRPLRLGDVDQATGFWSLPGRASQPLAGGGFAGFASFDPVTSTAILELRFAEDGRREPPEHATLRLRAGFGGEERILPRPIDIPLTVRDA